MISPLINGQIIDRRDPFGTKKFCVISETSFLKKIRLTYATQTNKKRKRKRKEHFIDDHDIRTNKILLQMHIRTLDSF